MAYENYTIIEFMNAQFKHDYSIISKEELKIVFTEYIDTAKLYESDEFSKVVYIHFLNNRINTIKLWIRLQKEFLNNFDVPFIEQFGFIFKKFGHIVKWNNSREDFILQLDRVEKREQKYISELENCIKILTESRLKNKSNDKSVELTRSSFIKTINSLGKIGWKIDKHKDTLEDLALIIEEQINEGKNSKT